MTLGELVEHVPMKPRVHVPRRDVPIEPRTDAHGVLGEPAADARREPGGDAWVEGAPGGVVGAVEVVSRVGL